MNPNIDDAKLQQVMDEAKSKLNDPDGHVRAAAVLLHATVPLIHEFKVLSDTREDPKRAADISAGLIDAMSMIMAALVTNVAPSTGLLLANRFVDGLGLVIAKRQAQAQAQEDAKGATKQ